uniref:Uncharacterized protein n=1 Tax=Arundo donax TaxID=35708 RepID=A0A0A8ZSW8_ARUDO
MRIKRRSCSPERANGCSRLFRVLPLQDARTSSSSSCTHHAGQCASCSLLGLHIP